MANVQGRLTGKASVCLATLGPGATPDIVELKVEPLQTGQEALTAGSAPAQKPVAKEARSFH